MEFLLIGITALAASILTFFSGFGLGTILLPVFAIYYPIEIAVALTAVVHLLNNLFKMGLVSKNINWSLVFKFGIPSMIAAFAGAYLLKELSIEPISLTQYHLGEKEFHVSLTGFVLGILIVLFAVIELSPKLSAYSFKKEHLISGGLISGFFGGLSGHQGALRSAFLLKLQLDKKVYIASGVMIACLVDVARLSLYSNFDILKSKDVNFYLLITAVLSAWTGAFIGNKIFKKTSIQFFKWFVGVFMLIMGLLIATGIVA